MPSISKYIKKRHYQCIINTKVRTIRSQSRTAYSVNENIYQFICTGIAKLKSQASQHYLSLKYILSLSLYHLNLIFKTNTTFMYSLPLTGQSEASTGQSEALTGQSEVLTGQSKASTRQSEASTGQSEASTRQSEALTRQSEVLTGQSEASTRQSTPFGSKTEMKYLIFNLISLKSKHIYSKINN